ncbi:GP179 protein, partial [Chordeiles acutipennis]|nr:GP179 protein [Chordeiles acutipennis]
AKPIPGSSHPSTAGTRRAAAKSPGTEVCPRGAPSVPAGKGALLRQEAIASQEGSGVPLDKEKGDSQPEPLGPSRGAERVPPRSRSAGVTPAAPGKADSTACREAELCPGEIQANSSIKIEICPCEESEGEDGEPGRALGVGGSDGESPHPGEDQSMEIPPAKTPEMPKGALETMGNTKDRRAEVCPWETSEGERTFSTEICPWDTAPASAKGSSQRGSPSPREGAEQPSTGITVKHPALPKMSSGQVGTIDSKKANVCPWEVEDEPLPKTEICPWEEPAAPSGKERPSQDTCGTSKGENKPGSRGLE